MGFMFGRARRQFEKTQAKLRKEYRAAGMDEEQIMSMYELDLHLFNRDVAYITHNQSLEACSESSLVISTWNHKARLFSSAS